MLARATPLFKMQVPGSSAPVARGGQAGPSSPRPPAPEGLSPRDVHVLLVDDERLARMVVGSLLRKLEYRGKEGDAREGSESARVCVPVVVVARRGPGAARAA